jgi:CDP-paratose 2-epimerase
MKIAIVTGSNGLVGAASVRHFTKQGLKVVGIDNDMRSYFFGKEASTTWARTQLEEECPGFTPYSADIRDAAAIDKIFEEYGKDIAVVIHTAAQPSHDWAAKEPVTDFTVNANGTLVVLEATRRFAPEAVFIFTSTNKVYGDTPNYLPLVELEHRWEIDESHAYFKHGIDESMSIDQTKHSLFGASKAAADILVQEYGRYFGMKTGVFRGGCLTGPGHSGAMLHGFLAYLMRCAITGDHYTVFGYQGKQVRDNIHSYDLVNAFYEFYKAPRVGEVYNIGGARHSNCSMAEAIKLCEQVSGNKMSYSYSETNRVGDHIWWVSNVNKFKAHYPSWNFKFSLTDTLQEMHDEMVVRLQKAGQKGVGNL